LKPTDEAKSLGKPLVDQIADRHEELESIIKTAVRAYKEVTQPERRQEWHLAVLLVAAVLSIIGLSGALSCLGRFTSEIAFIMGRAPGGLCRYPQGLPVPSGGVGATGATMPTVRPAARAVSPKPRRGGMGPRKGLCDGLAPSREDDSHNKTPGDGQGGRWRDLIIPTQRILLRRPLIR
jgi:hypothetical protein